MTFCAYPILNHRALLAMKLLPPYSEVRVWVSVMYVRFQGQVPNAGTNSKLGIFRLAGELCDHPETPGWTHDLVSNHLKWLNANLVVPAIQCERAIFWFRDDAREIMRHLWALKALLEEFGYYINVITCSAPGVVVYEDEHQIAAIPFRKSRRKRPGAVVNDAPAGVR